MCVHGKVFIFTSFGMATSQLTHRNYSLELSSLGDNLHTRQSYIYRVGKEKKRSTFNVYALRNLRLCSYATGCWLIANAAYSLAKPISVLVVGVELFNVVQYTHCMINPCGFVVYVMGKLQTGNVSSFSPGFQRGRLNETVGNEYKG